MPMPRALHAGLPRRVHVLLRPSLERRLGFTIGGTRGRGHNHRRRRRTRLSFAVDVRGRTARLDASFYRRVLGIEKDRWASALGFARALR